MSKETVMSRPITVTYEWLHRNSHYNEVCSYTAETYEDWHRVVRLLHENTDSFRVLSVKRQEIQNA